MSKKPTAKKKSTNVCDACDRDFPKPVGLAVHRRSCKKLHEMNGNLAFFPGNGTHGAVPQASGSGSRPAKRVRFDALQLHTTEKGLENNLALPPDQGPEASIETPINDINMLDGVYWQMKEPTVLPDTLETIPELPEFLPEDRPEGSTTENPNSGYFVPPPTRRGRERRFPKRFDDFLPCTSTHIPHMPPRPPTCPPPAAPTQPDPVAFPSPPPPLEIELFMTNLNEFGMYRVYPTFPSKEIDENEELVNVCDGPGFPRTQTSHSATQWEKSSGLSKDAQAPEPNKDGNDDEKYGPFRNITIYRLFRWFYTGSNMKSVGELDRLVEEVLDKPDYDPDHIKGFKAKRILGRIDKFLAHASPFSPKYGWKISTVHLPLNCEGVTYSSEKDCPTLPVPNVHHRSLVDAIKSALTDDAANQFHFTPFRQFWKATDDAVPERVITELYNSDAFYDEHIKLMNRQPPLEQASEPKYETAIAAMMLWSDSTHLANFGNASLWPIYLYFGNLSKYARAKPSSCAAHHVAYIPSLPSNLQDIYMKAFNGATASKDTISHLKRELMHAVWLLMLDGEFMKAYEHGIVIKCVDGIIRRIFPRFFTYSADYPEKVLLATIKYLAKCPCATCTTQKKYIPALGTHVDNQRRAHKRCDNAPRQFDIAEARKDIYERGKGPKSKFVNSKLESDSSIPVNNAFSKRLYKFDFNFYDMFVPDLLHEFELGVWKAVFTHLMRILYSTGDNAIQVLNNRYRDMPSFGETIRKFGRNAAAMSKMPGREFEDLLQCAIPVFEGLLCLQHSDIIRDMLFILATWHGLAKLRLHTESTIAALKENTRLLGEILRKFVKVVCPLYDCKELPKEEAARARRQANAIKKGKQPTSARSRKGKDKATVPGEDGEVDDETDADKATKTLNMFTYKLHSLGHYVEAIWKYGPSDNYSTQTGEVEHKSVKSAYDRTNKGPTFEKQVAVHHQRGNFIRRFGERLARGISSLFSTSTPIAPIATVTPSNTLTPTPGAPTESSTSEPAPVLESTTHSTSIPPANNLKYPEESLPPSTLSPDLHVHLPISKKKKINVFTWVHENSGTGDLAFTDFIVELKTHLLSRILNNSDPNMSYSAEDLSCLELKHDAMYEHSVLRVNYTTYDVRRSQDSINPRTHCNILTLSRDNNPLHPYSYGRVIRSFHADVTYTRDGPHKIVKPVRMEFLWVRWYELDDTFVGGWDARRLHRLRFVPHNSRSTTAFSFLDPHCIIRGAHLLPAFAYGTTNEYLPCESIARNEEIVTSIGHEDYRYYYVNMFVDRDMMMRYFGGGVGHMATNDLTKMFRPGYMTLQPPTHPDIDMEDARDGGNDDSDLFVTGTESIVNFEEEEDEDRRDSDSSEEDQSDGHPEEDEELVDELGPIAVVLEQDEVYERHRYAPL